jgi:hypothetical protein
MIAVLPIHPIRIDESQECFINESRSLQCVIRLLPPHIVAGNAFEFGLNVRDQFVQGGSFALSPGE